jgi:hypothetical protein
MAATVLPARAPDRPLWQDRGVPERVIDLSTTA